MTTKLFDVNEECKCVFYHEVETKQEILKWVKVDHLQFYLDMDGNVFHGVAGGDVKQFNKVMQSCTDILAIDRELYGRQFILDGSGQLVSQVLHRVNGKKNELRDNFEFN